MYIIKAYKINNHIFRIKKTFYLIQFQGVDH
jgi:hypothetical protein